jgi:phosphate-selective porin OprO/OprP
MNHSNLAIPSQRTVFSSGGPVGSSRRGLEIASRGGAYQARVWGRVQLRFSNPLDEVPTKEDDFRVHENHFGFRRARLNVEANVFRPWIEADFTYDLANTQPIGYFATITRYEWLQFRFGQSKPEFSRERVTSSARQQFAERSIINEVFNADRQIGFGLRGHLMPNSRGDSWYSVGIFTGNGRNNWFGGGGHPMLVARYQWNFLGRDLDFSSSDIEYHEQQARLPVWVWLA